MLTADCILFRDLWKLPGGKTICQMEQLSWKLPLLKDARAREQNEKLCGAPALQRDARATELEEARSVFFGAVGALLELAATNGFSGNLWQVSLAFLLASHENAFSTALEIGGEVSEGLRRAALHDMHTFRSLFSVDLSAIGEALSTSQHRLLLDFTVGNAKRCRLGRTIRERLQSLAEELAGAADEESFLEALEAFYREYGVGSFGLHKAFRIEHLPENSEECGISAVLGSGKKAQGFGGGHLPGAFYGMDPGVSLGMPNLPGASFGARIVPVTNVRQVSFDDLIGYESAKKLLIDNTEAFVEKRMANNCLLYGEAGTGKSSSIKALLDRFFNRGLRIIEITRYDFRDLYKILQEIKNRNYRFILYMDDLSFEENETEYKFLKAVIEGGLEKKPENVLLYATSNRRHLIRENYRDKEDRYQDMHASDTVQEKLSLSARFGLQIYFGSPEKKQYEEIVLALAEREGLALPKEELLKLANAWELRHGGYSGRAAQQLVDDLLSNRM